MSIPRILIADDHEPSRRTIRAALQKAGFDTLHASTLEDTSSFLRTPDLAAIILDAALFGGDTSKFLQHCRKTLHCPILLLTPPRSGESLLAPLRPLVDAILAKPFDVDELVEKIRSAKPCAAYGFEETGAASIALREETAPPSELAGCRLERILGRGAAGTVYLGRHLLLDIPVAVKVMHQSRLSAESEDLQRFIRGARAVARIRHPNIVPVIHAGIEAGFCFLVHQFIEGATLKQRLELEERVDADTAASIMEDIASALGAVHRNDIIHRDVKPGNIILAPGGTAMLTDFGLARPTGKTDISSVSEIIGTPLYMSPEQCDNRALDERSDLYSLGATAYHALAGRPPFTGRTPLDVLRGHASQPPAPLLDLSPQVPRSLAKIVMRLLRKPPAERFVSAEALLAALRILGDSRGT